jgi:hypothetical protein
MRIGEEQAYLTPEEEEKTKLESPLAVYEIDLHGLREAAVADLAHMERAFFQEGDETPVDNVFTSLGPEYESALARKIVFSKIAAELALRTVAERLLDEGDQG